MSYIPPDHRWQMPGYAEGEVARMRERNSKSGLAGMPTLVIILILPFLLVIKGGRFLYRKVRRSQPAV